MNLQENIQRIKEVMGIISEKLGDMRGIPLYHKTSAIRGMDIMSSDSLRGVIPSEEYLNLDKRLSKTKKQAAISFTRDRNWEPNLSIGIGLGSRLEDADITFVVDRNRLKTKYKIEPFNFIALDPDYVHTSKNEELEERVLTNEIYPLHKYLINIIYTGDNPEVKEAINNYLNQYRK